MNDLKFAFRQLLNNPGFTAVAVLTLALDIGANTAIFTVVNAVLLRPLLFQELERLVWVGGWKRDVTKDAGVTPADFLDYRQQCQSLAGLAACISDGISMTLTGNGEPEKLTGASVTFNYLDLFGVRPALGRTFIGAEEKDGSEQVAVLSHGLWERRFGADPSVINQTSTSTAACSADFTPARKESHLRFCGTAAIPEKHYVAPFVRPTYGTGRSHNRSISFDERPLHRRVAA